MAKKAIQIDAVDNVATVTSSVEAAEILEALSPDGAVIMTPKALEPIPFGHKIALKKLEKGAEVIKYGEVIGIASKPVAVGSWVHVHNVESATVPTSSLGKGEAA